MRGKREGRRGMEGGAGGSYRVQSLIEGGRKGAGVKGGEGWGR